MVDESVCGITSHNYTNFAIHDIDCTDGISTTNSLEHLATDIHDQNGIPIEDLALIEVYPYPLQAARNFVCMIWPFLHITLGTAKLKRTH